MSVYEMALKFKRDFPGTVAFRIKKHAQIVEKHLNPGEKPTFVFIGQKSNSLLSIGSSCAVAITDRRILIGKKRLLWGYFLSSITPDLYNDMQVYQGLLWGKVTIDTVKEEIVISSISKKGLDEIETRITEFMMQEKKKYQNPEQ